MRVLLAEDDSRLLMQLDQQLQQYGYRVDLADNGEHALFLLQEHPYAAAIIDIGLPKQDGLSVIRHARQQQITTPILILTARDRWQDKVEGLDAGADDYLTKPFHVEELYARVKALVRRAAGNASGIIQNGPLSLDTHHHSLSYEGQPILLTAQEYRLIEYLMLHIEEVVSKATLVEQLYDEQFDLDSNVIEVFVGRVRKKIDPDARLQPIETLRGRGYRLRKLT